MSALLAALAIGGLAVTSASKLPQGSLEHVRLRLDTERSAYYLGEPIRLTLKVGNDGDEGVWGYFQLAIGQDEADILYRQVGGRFVPLGSRRPGPPGFDGERFPMVLEPGQEQTTDAMLGLDPASGGFLLDRPGEYELKLVSRPRPRSLPPIVLETNVVRLMVDAPPAAELGAFAEYRRDELVVLAQAPLAALSHDPAAIRKATDFVVRHRHGVYAQHVRRGLLELLRSRMGQSKASPAERRLYDELRSNASEQN